MAQKISHMSLIHLPGDAFLGSFLSIAQVSIGCSRARSKFHPLLLGACYREAGAREVGWDGSDPQATLLQGALDSAHVTGSSHGGLKQLLYGKRYTCDKALSQRPGRH